MEQPFALIMAIGRDNVGYKWIYAYKDITACAPFLTFGMKFSVMIYMFCSKDPANSI